MFQSLYETFDLIAGWPVAILLVIAFVVCRQGFTWRRKRLGEHNRVLDVRIFYNPADVNDLFTNLGVEGRKLYAITQVTLDLAFPIIYGGLFFIILVRLYSAEQAWLLFFPLLAVTADFLENVSTASLALSYSGVETALSWLALAFTLLKWAASATTFVLIIAGVVIHLF